MKMHIASLSLLTLCCVMLAVIPAMAGYASGPPGLNIAQVSINFGNSVSDSYTLVAPVSTLDFVYWDPSNTDILTSIDVQFGASPFGGGSTTFVPTNTALLGGAPNKFGFYVFEAGVALGFSPPLGAGWMTLSNACTTSGCSSATTIGWDECAGPGCAGEAFTLFDRGSLSTYEGAMTSIPAESFTLTGSGGTTPEPSSIMLFGSGILGLAGVLRRRLNS